MHDCATAYEGDIRFVLNADTGYVFNLSIERTPKSFNALELSFLNQF